MKRKGLVILALVLALVAPSPAEAQFGRLRNMVAGVEKGEVYGLDVTEAGASVVFIVDLTPVIELPPGAAANLRAMVAEQGEAYVRQKLAAEGTDWMLQAAGPAGMAVRVALAQRKDRALRARNHARAAIEGLDEDQSFGLVTFEGGASTWHPMAAATSSNRDEARDFLGDLQKPEGDGFLRSALLTAAGLGLKTAVPGGLGAAAGSPIPGMAPAAAGMAGANPAALQAIMAGAGAGADPAAMQAMIAAAGAGNPQVQAAMAAALGASQLQGGVAPATVPDAPYAPTVSAENLLLAIQMALALEPETIVIVVGSAPAEDAGVFVASVADLVAGRMVTIHTAVFGEDQPGGVLRGLAQANDGRLLTENED